MKVFISMCPKCKANTAACVVSKNSAEFMGECVIQAAADGHEITLGSDPVTLSKCSCELPSGGDCGATKSGESPMEMLKITLDRMREAANFPPVLQPASYLAIVTDLKDYIAEQE